MTPLLLERPISVAILYLGGEAGDLADTVEAVEGFVEALTARGHTVRTMQVTKKNWRKAVKIPGDVVFNCVEDHGWELYIKIGMALEKMGRAQMGHDRSAFKYILKKVAVKNKMEANGVSTPKFKVFNRRSKIGDIRALEYPVIVKPSGEHAGIGISQDSVVIDATELKERVKYLIDNGSKEVVAEEYIEGREIHITVMGNGRHAVVMPGAEIEFGGEFDHNWSVYTYEAKWEKKSWEYWDARIISPARISKKLEQKMERLALKAFRVFGCRDIARFDIRVDDKERVYIVDVNMSPSLNVKDDQDATVASIKAMGWDYGEFLETLVAMTYKRVHGRLPAKLKSPMRVKGAVAA